jgi:transcriptional regulator with XRE-family HTH domain
MAVALVKTPTVRRRKGKGSRSRNGSPGGFVSEARGGALVAAIRAASGLSQEEFARLTGYSTRAVAGWEAGKPLARAGRRRFAEIGRLLKALAELMPPGQVGRWLREPSGEFDGQTPMQVVERGEADRVWQMIHQIDANVAN